MEDNLRGVDENPITRNTYSSQSSDARSRRRVVGIGCGLFFCYSDGPPTSTPEPTPTLAPNPTFTPVPLVVDTEVLDLASTRAFVILEEILEKLGPRESATDQESAAARYLQTKLQDLGYETEIQ